MAATVVIDKGTGKHQLIYRPPGGGKKKTCLYSTRALAIAERDRLNARDREAVEAYQQVGHGNLLGGFLFPAWLQGIKGTVSDSTQIQYTSQANTHLIPYFREFDMRRIDRREAMKFGRHLVLPKPEGAGLAVASVKTVLTLLTAALHWAADQNLITHVPRHLVREGRSVARKSAPVEKREKGVRAWSLEERGHLLEVAAETDANTYAALFVLLESGIRCGELFGLEWRHVDFGARELLIEQRLSRKRGNLDRKLAPPKGGLERRVRMSPELTEFLRKLHRKRSATHGLDKRFPELPVLVDAAGERWHEKSFDEPWNRVRQRAHVKHGVRPHKLHCTRSTFATIALTGGAPLSVVCNALGDTQAVVQRHYSGFIKDHDPDVLFNLTSAARRAALASSSAN